MESLSIAIIGCGLAGLSAAQLLNQSGLKVQLFEKSRGTGGRMSSRRTGIGVLDLGTRYITAQDPRFLKTLHDWQEQGWVQPWSTPVHVVQNGQINSINKRQERWIGIPSSSAITRGLLGEIPAHFNCRIAEVFHGEDHWILQDTADNTYGPFSHVIVAVPGPQASALLASSPLLAHTAAHVSMEPVWSVMLGFNGLLETHLEAAMVHDSPLEWISSDRGKPGRNNTMDTWCLQANHHWSRKNLDQPKDWIIEQLGAAFAQVLNCPIPDPTFSMAHRWLYGSSVRKQEWTVLADPESGIYACGDWCLNGQVESAWLSGQETARRLLENI